MSNDTYRIEQDFDYVGNEYWNWSAWIETDASSLQRIASVVWKLHPTFRPSRITSEDARNKFKLTTSGWGTFTLRADLVFKDGHTTELTHELELERPADEDAPVAFRGARPRGGVSVKPPPPPGPSAATKPKQPTVYLAYSSSDAETASSLRESLTVQGVRVLGPDTATSDEPFQLTVQRLIDESDLVLGYTGSDFVSPSLVAELIAADRLGKRSAFFTEGETRPYGLPESATMLTLSGKAGAVDAMSAYVHTAFEHPTAPSTDGIKRTPPRR